MQQRLTTMTDLLRRSQTLTITAPQIPNETPQIPNETENGQNIGNIVFPTDLQERYQLATEHHLFLQNPDGTQAFPEGWTNTALTPTQEAITNIIHERIAAFNVDGTDPLQRVFETGLNTDEEITEFIQLSPVFNALGQENVYAFRREVQLVFGRKHTPLQRNFLLLLLTTPSDSPLIELIKDLTKELSFSDFLNFMLNKTLPASEERRQAIHDIPRAFINRTFFFYLLALGSTEYATLLTEMSTFEAISAAYHDIFRESIIIWERLHESLKLCLEDREIKEANDALGVEETKENTEEIDREHIRRVAEVQVLIATAIAENQTEADKKKEKVEAIVRQTAFTIGSAITWTTIGTAALAFVTFLAKNPEVITGALSVLRPRGSPGGTASPIILQTNNTLNQPGIEGSFKFIFPSFSKFGKNFFDFFKK